MPTGLPMGPTGGWLFTVEAPIPNNSSLCQVDRKGTNTLTGDPPYSWCICGCFSSLVIGFILKVSVFWLEFSTRHVFYFSHSDFSASKKNCLETIHSGWSQHPSLPVLSVWCLVSWHLFHLLPLPRMMFLLKSTHLLSIGTVDTGIWKLSLLC